MTLIRTVHDKENPYMMINAHVVNDNKISWQAVGVFFFLATLDPGWEFSLADIIHQSTDGGVIFGSALKELENAGYLQVKREANKSGFDGKIQWCLFENPKIGTAKNDG